MQNDLEISVLERISGALLACRVELERFSPGKVVFEYKLGLDPVTEADRVLDSLLKKLLLAPGEGWLSEETRDNPHRLSKERVWVVDPLDGTREFVSGIPEWCISIAYVENGVSIAGGICNPATGETFLGSRQMGLVHNGRQAEISATTTIDGALVLASRSEVNRGEWNRFSTAPFRIQAMGSVAYKMARVAAGLADATFTLSPKNEWDIGAGTALVEAAGGCVVNLENRPVRFNNVRPLLSGMLACSPNLRSELVSAIQDLSEVSAQHAQEHDRCDLTCDS
jgi:myo-inositol-1(or 4)-monophosphatase